MHRWNDYELLEEQRMEERLFTPQVKTGVRRALYPATSAGLAASAAPIPAALGAAAVAAAQPAVGSGAGAEVGNGSGRQGNGRN